ncbi:MAG: hypothetical protein GY809_09100 [Planctomycetes bacterium]|nr:hypothetical protein [Planctomycetota bacterium]
MGYIREINIYVYQIGDHEYGAGFIRRVCESRGRIVEVWPVNSASEIEYVTRHSSKYEGVYDLVKSLAERAREFAGQADVSFDEERETVLIDLSALSFGKRLSAGLKVIFGRYQEK